MKPWLPISLITITCLTLSLSIPGYSQTEADYEKQLQALSATIDKLQQELSKTKGSRDDLQQSLQQSEEEIGELTRKIETIKEALHREKKN